MLVDQHDLKCRLPVRGVEDTGLFLVVVFQSSWFSLSCIGHTIDVQCRLLSEVLRIQGPFLVLELPLTPFETL